MKRRSSIQACLSCIVALSAGPVAADVTLTQKVSIEAGGALAMLGSSGETVTLISGDKARSDTRMEAQSGLMSRLAGNTDSSTLVRMDREMIYQLQPAERQYSAMTFEELREQTRASLAELEEMQQEGALPVSDEDCEWSEPVLDVDKTRETEKFAGVKARRTLITASQTCTVPDTGQQCEMRWTLDYWLAKRMPGDDEAEAYTRRMAEAMGGEEMLSVAQAQARGLMAMFRKGWDEVLQESGGLEGFPAKSVMSLEIGGEDCTTSTGQPIAMDDIWGRAADAGYDAAAGSAAAAAGDVAARQAAESVGGGIGGSIAGSAVGAASREITSGLFKRFKKSREEEPEEPVERGPSPSDKVMVFTISTELTDVSDRTIDGDTFEIPDDWTEVASRGF